MVTILCGADDVTWVRTYRPVLIVEAALDKTVAGEVYLRFVKTVSEEATLDMSDGQTAYVIGRFGLDGAIRHGLGIQYVDAAGVLMNSALLRPPGVEPDATKVSVIIGYGRDPIPGDTLQQKAEEIAQELEAICAGVNSKCSAVIKHVVS